MKLTIEIPDAHTGEVLRYLAGLIPAGVELAADPAPGHPELPLVTCTTEDDGDLRWCVAGELDDPAAADPLKVVMDDPIEDPRPRLIPLPGKRYRNRMGGECECIAVDNTSIECRYDVGNFHYHHDGTPFGHASREWECVEELPPIVPQAKPGNAH
jgi:hypothetical protein